MARSVTPPQTLVVAPALEQVENEANARQAYTHEERSRSPCDDAGTRSTFAIQLLSNSRKRLKYNELEGVVLIYNVKYQC